MSVYKNLPGIQIFSVDRGLTVQQQPVADATLIISTSGQGPANQPYSVQDRSVSAATFGLQGNLIRAQEEVMSGGCDNVILFRMGTSPMVLTGVGVQTGASATAGFNLTFGAVTSTAPTDYSIWYKAGVLCIYYKNVLIYSNDPLQATDTGDLTIDGLIAGNTGLVLGTGASGTSANAITIQAAAALAGATNTPAPVLTQPVTGIGLTGRQQFVAFLNAINLLQGYQVKQVVVPEALFDAPNVAFYVSSNSVTAINNPVTNSSALDWLKTTVDVYGSPTFQWASETTDSKGGTVSAMVAATAAARLTAGFHEVSWGYALADYCASLSQLNNTCIGFIGTSGPASYKLTDVRKWVGFLPKYDASGSVTTAGAGLCGIPYVAGTNTSGLNTLCADYAAGVRQPGFFQTNEGVYDGGTAVVDKNQNAVDIGAFLHVVADRAIVTNGFASKYVSNLALFTAGVCSVLDEKIALTNLSVPVTQLPALVYTPGQLDSLTAVNINVLKSKGSGVNPALLHDKTVATSASDYTQVLRMRIKGLAIAILLKLGDPFIGSSSLDGLQCTAMKTKLDNGLSELAKRGYLSKPSLVISTTAANQRIGKASLYLQFHPADQLVKLDAFVGFTN